MNNVCIQLLIEAHLLLCHFQHIVTTLPLSTPVSLSKEHLPHQDLYYQIVWELDHYQL